ncbi:MAG: hypothetical protein IT176_09320 [Acidobacteria bacterium]|nr:hypothetical protein [Acidobacteriota bacterium]
MRIVIPLLVLLAAPIGRAGATVLVPTDLRTLSQEAQAIVRGRVVDLEPQWSVSHRTIETVVSLEVDEALKGAPGGLVRFRVPGGVLGRYRSVIVGAPQFVRDQRVIVFLKGRAPEVPYLVGLSQGVYRVGPDAGGTGWIVTPPPLAQRRAPSRMVRGDRARVPLPLDRFETQVRSLVGAGR